MTPDAAAPGDPSPEPAVGSQPPAHRDVASPDSHPSALRDPASPAASPPPAHRDVASPDSHPPALRDLASPASQPSAPRDPAGPELRPRVVLGALLVLIGLVLLPQLGFGFVSDDGWTLVANGFLRVPGDLWLLFTPEAVTRNVPDAFRPGLVVFDVLTYQLLGLDARLHHAVSIALHLGVCAVLAAWLRRLGAPLALWAATVAVFGLLAIHAEAIAVVSFREDLLAALLGLLACLAASAAVRGRLRLAAPAVLLSLVACACKQSAAAVPLLWLLAEALAPWQRPRPPTRRLLLLTLALLAGAAVVFAHTTWLYGQAGPYGATNLRLQSARDGLGPVLAMSTQIHLGYLQQMLAPFGLSPEYVDRGAAWTEPATVLASAALLALLLAGLASARRRPLVALAILGAFALALPTSNLAAMPNMRADRFMYLPSAPVCLGLAALLLLAGRRLADRLREPNAWLVPVAAFSVLQGAVLVGAGFTYRNNTTLWTLARERAPGSARAQAVTGELLIASLGAAPTRERRDLQLAQARAHCIVAERLDPHYELPQLCFARLAAAGKDWAGAHRRFAAALAVSPDRNARIHAGLVQTSLDLPRRAADERRRITLEALDRGLAEYPYSPELHDVAGQIFHRLGEPDRARLHYQRALTLAPERGEPLLGLVALLLDLGQPLEVRDLVAANTRTWLAADVVDRTALIARHRDALRLYAPTMVRFADLVGVFADEP
jgi:tetratricopeptide (TPR) repeat protein